jgi:hypothetical protein
MAKKTGNPLFALAAGPCAVVLCLASLLFAEEVVLCLASLLFAEEVVLCLASLLFAEEVPISFLYLHSFIPSFHRHNNGLISRLRPRKPWQRRLRLHGPLGQRLYHEPSTLPSYK